MNNEKTTNQTTNAEARETPKIRLLKCSRVKDGKRFDNLYLQVNDGNPIAIRLSFDNFKVKNMLLANATPCEIKNVTLVRETKESEF